jgi:hypothetical protein
MRELLADAFYYKSDAGFDKLLSGGESSDKRY